MTYSYIEFFKLWEAELSDIITCAWRWYYISTFYSYIKLNSWAQLRKLIIIIMRLFEILLNYLLLWLKMDANYICLVSWIYTICRIQNNWIYILDATSYTYSGDLFAKSPRGQIELPLFQIESHSVQIESQMVSNHGFNRIVIWFCPSPSIWHFGSSLFQFPHPSLIGKGWKAVLSCRCSIIHCTEAMPINV